MQQVVLVTLQRVLVRAEAGLLKGHIQAAHVVVLELVLLHNNSTQLPVAATLQ